MNLNNSLWGCVGVLDITEFLHLCKQLVLKFLSLIMVEFGRESVPENKVAKDLFCYGFRRLIFLHVYAWA